MKLIVSTPVLTSRVKATRLGRLLSGIKLATCCSTEITPCLDSDTSLISSGVIEIYVLFTLLAMAVLDLIELKSNVDSIITTS